MEAIRDHCPKGGLRRNLGCHPSNDAGPRTAAIERIPDPAEAEAVWEKEWQQHRLNAACERIARRVNARHFQVFDLFVRQKWPVLKVAKELGINPVSVHLIAHRLTKPLKKEVEILLKLLS